MTEMSVMCEGGHYTWLTRVNKIEKLLNLPKLRRFTKSTGKQLSSVLKSKFDIHWLGKVKTPKVGPDNIDHNKL